MLKDDSNCLCIKVSVIEKQGCHIFEIWCKTWAKLLQCNHYNYIGFTWFWKTIESSFIILILCLTKIIKIDFNSEMNMMYIIEKVYSSHSLYKYIFLNVFLIAVIDLDTQKILSCHWPINCLSLSQLSRPRVRVQRRSSRAHPLRPLLLVSISPALCVRTNLQGTTMASVPVRAARWETWSTLIHSHSVCWNQK